MARERVGWWFGKIDRQKKSPPASRIHGKKSPFLPPNETVALFGIVCNSESFN